MTGSVDSAGVRVLLICWFGKVVGGETHNLMSKSSLVENVMYVCEAQSLHRDIVTPILISAG